MVEGSLDLFSVPYSCLSFPSRLEAQTLRVLLVARRLALASRLLVIAASSGRTQCSALHGDAER